MKALSNVNIWIFFFFITCWHCLWEISLCFWRLDLRPQKKCLIWHQVWKQRRQNENRELNVIKSHIFIRWQRWKTNMGKADTDVAFSSLLSITATLSSLKAAWWVWRWSQCLKATAKTHTSSIGNLWPFAQLMSTNTEPNPQCKHNGFPVFSGGHLGHLLFCTFPLLPIITTFSSVHPPILFPQAGTEPEWALNTLGITRTHPTHKQWESYSRKEQTLVQDMNRQKLKIWGSCGKWRCCR